MTIAIDLGCKATKQTNKQMDMEHLLDRSKCSIFHNIFKYVVVQRHQKELFWSKGLSGRLFFLKISKFAHPGIMFKIEQASNFRKKKKKDWPKLCGCSASVCDGARASDGCYYVSGECY